MAKPPQHRSVPRSCHTSYNQPTLRNPWLEGHGGPPGHGPGPGPGSHSSGSTTYEGYVPVNDPYVPEPPQPWRQIHGTAASTPVYEVPEGAGQRPQPVCTLPHSNTQNRYVSSSDRPVTPGGLSQLSGNAAGPVTGCGGCDAVDTWCYYCVQGVLGVAALAGLSLLIAAGVLRGQPPRAAASANLSALPYIGAMLAIVSGALLMVQLFARNEKKRKKRRLQQLREQRAASAGVGGTLRRPIGDTGDLIPLQELHKFPSHTSGPVPVHSGHTVPPSSGGHLVQQFQPLLARSSMRQQQQSSRHHDVILSPNGTPWWRRQQAHPGRVVYPS